MLFVAEDLHNVMSPYLEKATLQLNKETQFPSSVHEANDEMFHEDKLINDFEIFETKNCLYLVRRADTDL